MKRKRGLSMNLKLLTICGVLLIVFVTATSEAQAPKPDYKVLVGTSERSSGAVPFAVGAVSRKRT